MTAFETIQHQLKPELTELNTRIHSALASPNKLMNTVIESYLTSKGKLIRPILVMLTARLFGSVTERVISAAAAVEMLHNASLIHDDVVDNSTTRRNKPTINAVWDNHIAVLVGDFFVSTALQQAISTGDLRIVESLSTLGKTLSLGEIDQIYNARYHCLNEEAYFQIIGRKTASLFVSCVRMGAYAVDVDDERLHALSQFAEILGLCFQIKDDIFDYFPAEKIGKPSGNDLREGKITLPLLYALSLTNRPEHKEMDTLAHSETLTDEQINTLTQYAIEAGGIDYAYATMQHLRDRAVEILKSVAPEAKTKPFAELLDFIIARDH